ncbi:MAG: tetratricopeptide repeat protein [Candidatus Adiutrix intracellularis]|jgi:type IV pilus assembly protein PilF|nr:tetratricopeptide repeat protein [Candidatus Adiutrix intracellularis]
MIRRAYIKGLILVVTLLLATPGCIALLDGYSQSRSVKEPSAADQAQVLINLSTAFLMQGEYTKALPELLKARELTPKNTAVHNYLGLSYYGMKEYALAIESFQRALAINPNRTDVHNNLGLVYLAQKYFDLALAEFNLCLKDPNYQKKQIPLSNIGLVYLELGQYDEAMQALTRATEVAPDYPKSYQFIGRVHLDQGNYGLALDYMGNAAHLDPNDAETFMLLGEVYLKLNKPEEAAQAYNRAAALVPNTQMALEAQKRVHQVMGF